MDRAILDHCRTPAATGRSICCWARS